MTSGITKEFLEALASNEKEAAEALERFEALRTVSETLRGRG